MKWECENCQYEISMKNPLRLMVAIDDHLRKNCDAKCPTCGRVAHEYTKEKMPDVKEDDEDPDYIDPDYSRED